jgi:hypothetical protein
VEHVNLALRGCDTGISGATDGDEVEVYDPRGTFTSQRKAVNQRVGAPAGAAGIGAGSLESEARKLIAAFERNGDGHPNGKARKVRGRGRVMAGMKGSAGTDSDMGHHVVARSSSGGPTSVAALHLHTPEQRAQYQQTHDKYRRARGVTLLHHIAKAYGLHIVIQPAGSSESSPAVAQAAMNEKAAADSVAAPAPPAKTLSRTVILSNEEEDEASSAVSAVSVAAMAPVPVTARPARLFTTALSQLRDAPVTAAPSKVSPHIKPVTAPVSLPSASSRTAELATAPVISREPVRIKLQRSISAPPQEGTSLAPATTDVAVALPISLSQPVRSNRRTFDAGVSSTAVAQAAAPVASPIASPESSPAAISSSAFFAAPPPRKLLNLKLRGEPAGINVPASAIANVPSDGTVSGPAVPAASPSQRPALQLSRKRRAEEDAPDASAVAASAVPQTPLSMVVVPASSSVAARSSTGSSAKPAAKRPRGGGLLGAALHGIRTGGTR